MLPLTTATRFTPPIFESRSGASSPSMSPRRHMRFDDSLTQELSPSIVVQAFYNDTYPTEANENSLLSSIRTASATERDLGARVAKAAEKLKEWCLEVEKWGWTGTFQPSSRETNGKTQDQAIGQSGNVEISPETSLKAEFWGSLPAEKVKKYEDRIEQISIELSTLEIDELKERILNIHGALRSRPSSSYSNSSSSMSSRLDDFSILITHILLQSLPCLSRLRRLLDSWTSRLAVSREVPTFLAALTKVKTSLEFGWQNLELSVDYHEDEQGAKQWAEAMISLRDALQRDIIGSGQRLDRMLDLLEGREDILPDKWIDDFENLEAEYSRWTVELMRRLMDVAVHPKTVAQEGNTKKSSQPVSVLKQGDGRQQLVTESEQKNQPSPDEENGRNAIGSIFARARSQSYVSDPAVPSESQSRISSAQHAEMLEKNDPPLAASTNNNRELVHPNAKSDASEAGSPETVHHAPIAPLLRKASVTSVEAFSRAQVKSINVRRSSSSSSSSISTTVRDFGRERKGGITSPDDDTPTVHPLSNISLSSDMLSNHAKNNLSLPKSPHAPKTLGSPPKSPGSPSHGPRTPGFRQRTWSVSSDSSASSEPSSPSNDIGDSPSLHAASKRRITRPSRPPLNALMTKRRPKEDSAPGTSVWPPSKFSEIISDDQAQGLSPRGKNVISVAKDLETQISDILTTIPGHIRLATGSTINKSEGRAPRVMSTGRGMHTLRASRSFVKSPEMILSPVKSEESSSRKSSAARDTDVRVYHLTQPGKDQPIKLFVRRIGENGERVMVRVGGGWADLGEYLRQYAEHHGRRTASEGKFEVLGLGFEARPSTAISGKRVSSTATVNGHTPVKPITQTENPGPVGPDGPATTPTKETTDTPNSALSTGSSKHSWTGNEVGLAGPNSKKMELSEDKREWVEGMMNKAKRLSEGPQKTEFGDLGKVGGTKRVFLKGSGNSE